jgi:hypothetical protein
LNDKNNGQYEFESIALSLLSARPTEASIVHSVLAGLGRFPGAHLDVRFIQAFGNLKITSDEALAFIRAGFANPAVRPTSIEAVARMPPAVLDAFTKELQRTLADPTADPGTKSAASHALMHR